MPQKTEKRAKSLGDRMAYFVTIMVATAALLPSFVAVFLFLNALSVAQSKTSAFQVMNYFGRLSVFSDYAHSIPLTIGDAYGKNILKIDEASKEYGTKVLEADQASKPYVAKPLSFSQVLENQILQFDLIRYVSVLSTESGGMEQFKVGFTDGRPNLFEAASLNSTSDIPFFIETTQKRSGEVTISDIIVKTGINGEKNLDILVGSQVPYAEKVLKHGGGDIVVVELRLNDHLERQFKTQDGNSTVFLLSEEGEILFTNGNEERISPLIGNAWKKFEKGDTLIDNDTSHVVVNHNVVGRMPFRFSETGKRYYVAFTTQVQSPLDTNFNILVYIGSMILVIAVIGAVVAKRMTSPITKIVDLARRVAEGETTNELIAENKSSQEAQLLGEALVMIRKNLEKGKAKLAESNIRLQSATHAAGLGYFELQAGTRDVEIWSEELFELIGLTPELKSDRQLQTYVCEEYKEAYVSSIETTRTTGERVGIDVQILCGAGEPRWFSLIFVELTDAAGGGRRIMGTVQDVDQIKRAETIKSEFISTVSHELRTPMTSILGGLKMATAEAFGELDARYGKILNIAQNNAERLLRLIDQILYLEKDISSVSSIRPESFKIDDLIQSVILENEEFATKFKVHLENDSPGFDNQEMCADRDRINQVLTNLISNAVKFSGEGTTVKLITRFADGKVTFGIEDQGPGISDENMENIFKPFFQEDGSVNRTVEGTGLGLTITKSIIDMHNGQIDVFSSSSGAKFRVTLPQDRSARSDHDE